MIEDAANPRMLPFDVVEDALRKNNYGVLSTISPNGRPHSIGVLYAVSPKTKPLALYVTTRRSSRKARNITENSKVAFTVPVRRKLLKFAPPNSIQFQGTGQILPVDEESAVETFNNSRILRLTLKLEKRLRDPVMIGIRPDNRIHTYGMGVSLFSMIRRISDAGGVTEVPPDRR